MGRLNEAFLERVEAFCDRVLDVAHALAAQRRSARFVDQMSRSGTSIGANAYEAAEALSRPDFCKTLGIALKELNETRFWLRLCVRRRWVKTARLMPLQKEGDELRAIVGSIIAKSGRSSRDS